MLFFHCTSNILKSWILNVNICSDICCFSLSRRSFQKCSRTLNIYSRIIFSLTSVVLFNVLVILVIFSILDKHISVLVRDQKLKYLNKSEEK